MFKVIKGAPIEEVAWLIPLKELPPPPSEEVNQEKQLSPEEIMVLAQQQAAEMINRAKQEAKQIIQQTQSKAEAEARQMREQAKQAGWQEGITASQAEAEKIRQQASDVLRQSKEIYRQTLGKMEAEIVDLAVDIAERVVLTQLAVEPRTIMEIARECMDMVKNKPLVNLYVNHADYQMVQEGKNELLQGLPGKVEMNILVDNGITPGGCRIETDQGQVDATLETRWQEVFKVLYGKEE
ncbi:Flagellar biosynthesis/type III secretory pathway protein-like protein [Desulforamulus reducens MI-1]|uniref:Flagellar biosynthesis/type III secretory pathway protein-like protein n=1 Tax=Desulforamulus reducens (strain ATCC BAA-1160 / DSM 100696 / MI-1) TaxID=349161 RepID=A4J763_DESRM|nr:FliH/SctL family protein [Desulforamulus reducens]ABO50916.1 Flagellar biosynthesis/type III secretory pathway protein-like protein [Desulforamulus reducens MI-1]